MDSELRELERRWAQSGSTEDERAFVLGRLRAGVLDPRRVAVASALGHEAAIKASGRATVLDEWEDYEERLTHALAPLAEKDHVQFALSCAERTLPVWQRFRPGDRSMVDVLRATRALHDGRGSVEDWEKACQAAKESLSGVDRALAGPDFDLGRAAVSSVLSAALVVDRRARLGDTVEESIRICAAGAADQAVKAFDGAETEVRWQAVRLCRMLLGYADSEAGPQRTGEAAATSPSSGDE